MTKNFFYGAHAVIIVYALDSPSSFKSIENHLNNIDNYCKPDVIKILVGNKSDLEVERRCTYDDMNDKAQETNMKCFETSAIDSKNATIFELFNEISIMLC